MLLSRILLTIATAAAVKAEMLFEVADEILTEGIKECKAKGLVSCRAVAVNFNSVGDDTITIPLHGGVELDLSVELESGGLEYENSDGSSALLSAGSGRSGRKTLVATISIENPHKMFTIEPCDAFEDCHVLLEENDDQNEAVVDGVEVDDLEAAMERSTLKDLDIASLDRQEETQTLSVQFYYTDEFADVTSDPVAYIQGLVDSANTVYSKSNVPLQMYARCFTRLSSVKESDNAIDTLTAFRNSKSSDAAVRNSADVALLVVSGSIGGSCGIAYVNGFKHGITLGWVAKNCQRIVAAHEVGHMFGCAHNRGKHSFTPDGGYEYGNLMKDAAGKGYVTVMAYKDTDAGYTIRSYKFSSPDLLIQGVPTGSANTDVRRAHMGRKSIMVANGNERGVCSGEAGDGGGDSGDGGDSGSGGSTGGGVSNSCPDLITSEFCLLLSAFIECCDMYACTIFCMSTCGVC